MIGREVVRREVVGSTMDEVAILAAASAPEGIVVVADQQIAGRGRAGRTWAALPGTGLLCSILLRPTVPVDRLAVLSLVAGVAVAETIEAFGGAPTLKWPNDIWLSERKAAGILVTSRVGAGGAVAILGIGINVGTTPADLPDGATSLLVATGHAPDRDTLLSVLLDRVDRGYAAFVATDGQPDLSAWTRRAALLGEEVAIHDGAAEHTGAFSGIDHDGALLLRGDDGATTRIVAGDLTRGPRRTTRIG